MPSLRYLAVCLLCLWPLPAWATDFVVPKQAIIGAEKPVPLGELVDLSLSPLAEKPPHLVSVSASWKVLDVAGGQEKRVRDYEGGVFFGAGIKKCKLKAIVAVTYLYAVKGDDGTVGEVAVRTVFLMQDVQIGEDLPEPDPEPGPNPDPEPGPNPPRQAHLVIIEETREATEARGKFFQDRPLAEYVSSKGWQTRIADKDVKSADGNPPRDLKPYLNRASGKKLPYLMVVGDAGKIYFEGALPETPATLLTLLKKIGGDR